MTIPVKTCWVIVADEDKALILANAGTPVQPVLEVLARLDSATLLAVEDRSARAYIEPHHYTTQPPDFHRMAGATLAAAVAAYLVRAKEAGAQKGNAFESLILIAPPQMLGALRDALGRDLMAKVVAELHKTLTGHSLPDITRLVQAGLAAVR